MNKQDGVVIFFNSKKFALHKKMYLNTFIEMGQNYGFNDTLANEMYYPSMALFMVLTRTEGPDFGRSILIVNTHLLFNKNRGHVKLGMLVLILKAVQSIKKQYGIKDVFICGDFNLIPNSMLYEYLNTGHIDLYCGLRQYSNQAYIISQTKGKALSEVIKLADMKFKPVQSAKDDTADKTFLELLAATEVILPKDHEDEIMITRQPNVPKTALNELEKIYSSFSLDASLKSSYSIFNNKYMQKLQNKKEPVDLNFIFDPNVNNNDCFISQFSQDLCVPVDYIWYSSDSGYEPVKVLQTPNPQYLNSLPVSCPVDNFGSDHFSIAVDFVLREQ